MLGKVRGWNDKAIERWKLFWSFDPGHRFQTRYHSHRRRREKGETPKWVGLLNRAGGPVLIVAGFLFVPTPGPSYIIIVIGLWMVAGEWLAMARLLDRVEVRFNKVGRRAKDAWAHSPEAARVLVVLGATIALLYGIYRLFFGG
jgi:hypothetical protein